jgi:lipopolysaccharide export LptBFGC system permease protein LptF
MIGQVRLLRVVIAALLVEVGLAVASVPVLLLVGEQAAFQVAVPIACVLVPFVVALIATRPLPEARVLHGVLIGIVATLMYFVLVIGTASVAEAVASYGLPLFVVVNALRVICAAAGGYAADRRATPSAA